jgi:serine phosphatase RsbU (regulator of sigma subunit)
VFSDNEIPGWRRISARGNIPGWVKSENLAEHVPARSRGELAPADIRMVLDVLELEGVGDYSIFLEDGYILADSRNRAPEAAGDDEKSMIKQAIFKNSFENLAFFHHVDRIKRTVDLYLPIYYGANKLLVLKPTIPMQYVWVQTQYLYRQCIIIGLIILVVHILFVLANQRFIIKPMVRERTTVLEEKNAEIQKGKDELQGMYDQLNIAHTQIQEELNMARDIQLSMIPKMYPKLDGYSFFATYEPTEKVGGDFYDFYNVDPDHLGILIADASGHGIPAAFIVSMAKMAFSTHTRNQLRPAALLDVVNKDLEKVLISTHYLSCFYAILDIRTGQLCFSKAAHPSPYIYRKSTGAIEPIGTRGPMVGMLDDAEYNEADTIFEPGDRLLMFTDGINEAGDPADKLYGKDAIAEVLKRHGLEPPKEIVQSLLKDVREFVKGSPFADDATVLVIGREKVGKPE